MTAVTITITDQDQCSSSHDGFVVRTDDGFVVRTDDGFVVRTDHGTVGGSVIVVTIAITDHDQYFSSHDPRFEAEAHRTTIRVRFAGKETSQPGPSRGLPGNRRLTARMKCSCGDTR